MVTEAFEHCDTDKSETLSKDQFETWIKMNPSVINALETVFAKHVWLGYEDDDGAGSDTEMKDNLLKSASHSNLSLRNLESPRLSVKASRPSTLHVARMLHFCISIFCFICLF